MRPLVLIGNWKSNMTIVETREWFQIFGSLQIQQPLENDLSMILCVPYTVLATSKEIIEKQHFQIALAAQDVSPFGKGPYTGEISAEMLAELASYVLIGHSERRRYFGETNEELAYQVLQAKSAGLTVIYCISNVQERIPESIDIVAYEPIEAIGSGKPEDSNQVSAVCQDIYNTVHKPIVYGGSVEPIYVKQFIDIKLLHGLLLGGASLDPRSFFQTAQEMMK